MECVRVLSTFKLSKGQMKCLCCFIYRCYWLSSASRKLIGLSKELKQKFSWSSPDDGTKFYCCRDSLMNAWSKTHRQMVILVFPEIAAHLFSLHMHVSRHCVQVLKGNQTPFGDSSHVLWKECGRGDRGIFLQLVFKFSWQKISILSLSAKRKVL